jgi:hypothetical protein
MDDQQAGDTLQQAQPASGDPGGLFYIGLNRNVRSEKVPLVHRLK